MMSLIETRKIHLNRNFPFCEFPGPETDIMVQFLEPETDIMIQFLEPETEVMDEGNYILFWGLV
mgnify:CR=1 FL=1